MRLIEEAGKKRLFWHQPELFHVATVTPTIDDSFWVNLIGKGYPSPNRWFRWCTERLKINPTSRYIKETVGSRGETIIVLGTRKAESSNRAAAMNNHDSGGNLRKHDLAKTYVYAPIADLSNNEVWAYLLQAPSPWGGNNRALLTLYGNACKGGECPFVVDTGTQSCGKSRFGCWVCTVVDKDQAMESYVSNGHAWMKPLLEYRDMLYTIRQQTAQHVPRQLMPATRFGAFLLRTRRQLLDSLLAIQAATRAQLMSDSELARTKELLDAESRGASGTGLCFYTYHLKSGPYVRVLADYDIQQTPRQRLGPFHLTNAELLAREHATGVRTASRVMYRVLQKRPVIRQDDAASTAVCQQKVAAG
jgi:putative sulfurtransferase DndC